LHFLSTGRPVKILDIFSRQRLCYNEYIMNDISELKTTTDVLACIETPFNCVTRADIAKHLALSRTTVSTAVASLMQLGLVEEQPVIQDDTTAGRGRPGIPLKIRTDRWFAVGASFHTSTWFFVITDLTSKVVYKYSLKLSELSVDLFLHNLIKGLKHVIKKCPGRLLPMIGVGVPGLVNDKTGVILDAEDLGWHNILLGETILRHTGLPAVVLNRHRACALAEAGFELHQRADTFIYLGIDTGIIAAVIANGRLLAGANHCAGEIGHTIVDPHGAICQCGKQGCLQAMASLGALNRIIVEAYRADGDSFPNDDPFHRYLEKGLFIPGEAIMDAACYNHPVALAALRRISKYLGLAIGNLVNLLNPQTIILGGSLTFSRSELLTEFVTAEVARTAMAFPFSVVRILSSRLGIYSGAIGAASLPLERKLELALRVSSPT
jgi:predicted NBD/HSP70 family sugar kinase